MRNSSIHITHMTWHHILNKVIFILLHFLDKVLALLIMGENIDLCSHTSELKKKYLFANDNF